MLSSMTRNDGAADIGSVDSMLERLTPGIGGLLKRARLAGEFGGALPRAIVVIDMQAPLMLAHPESSRFAAWPRLEGRYAVALGDEQAAVEAVRLLAYMSDEPARPCELELATIFGQGNSAVVAMAGHCYAVVPMTRLPRAAVEA
jgi:hypothetical protein